MADDAGDSLVMNTTTMGALLAVAGGGSFLFALLLTALVRHVATRVDFVDRPGGHKSHRAPTPYGGGIAIFTAAMVPIAALLAVSAVVPEELLHANIGEAAAYLGGLHAKLLPAVAVLLGAVAIHILGLRDDVKPLGPYLKLIILLIIATLVAHPQVGNVRMALFAGEIGSVVLTVIWIVVIANAFNFLDNMDGLSAGVAAICMAFFAICGLLAGQFLVPALACVFLGAIAGFLVFNFPPATIFMGDAGSLLCGYMLAVVSILTTYYHAESSTPPYALLMPFVVLAVPLYDFVSVIGIRLAEGRNPMRGDQRHFSHRLVEHGLSRRFAVITIYLASGATGLAATLLPGADLRETITIAVMVLLVLLIIAILESPPRKEA